MNWSVFIIAHSTAEEEPMIEFIITNAIKVQVMAVQSISVPLSNASLIDEIWIGKFQTRELLRGTPSVLIT